MGLKWRRQHVIGPYVVDFFCFSAGLVVEVDGLTHAGRDNQDEHRTRIIEREGFRVIRFTDDEVLRNLEGVVTSIGAAASLDT